jgi:hypothetical protein
VHQLEDGQLAAQLQAVRLHPRPHRYCSCNNKKNIWSSVVRMHRIPGRIPDTYPDIRLFKKLQKFSIT